MTESDDPFDPSTAQQQPPDALAELEKWCDDDKPLTDVMISRSNTWWYRRFKEEIARLRGEPK